MGRERGEREEGGRQRASFLHLRSRQEGWEKVSWWQDAARSRDESGWRIAEESGGERDKRFVEEREANVTQCVKKWPIWLDRRGEA